MDSSQYHIHRDRYIWSKQGKREYATHKTQWSRWWHTSKAFHNKRDGRTFAEVVKQPAETSGSLHTRTVSNNVQLQLPRSHKSWNSQIVATKTFVTTNTKPSCHSTSTKSNVLRPPQAVTKDYIPIKNRFALLENISGINTDEKSDHNVNQVANVVSDHNDSSSDIYQIDLKQDTTHNHRVSSELKLQGHASMKQKRTLNIQNQTQQFDNEFLDLSHQLESQDLQVN